MLSNGLATDRPNSKVPAGATNDKREIQGRLSAHRWHACGIRRYGEVPIRPKATSRSSLNWQKKIRAAHA